MKTITTISSLLLLTQAPACFGAASVFFSNLGFGQGATLGNPTVMVNPSQTVDLHIYMIPDVADATYRSVAVDISTTNSTAVSAPSYSILGPGVVLGATLIGPRWDGTNALFGTGNTLLSNMAGVAVGAQGLNRLNNGASGGALDEGYDASAGAFYFGSVSIQGDSPGSAELFFSVGQTLFVRDGDAASGEVAMVQFGVGDAPVSGQAPTGPVSIAVAPGSLADATIVVVPEPHTMTLLVAMLAPLCLKRRRRR